CSRSSLAAAYTGISAMSRIAHASNNNVKCDVDRDQGTGTKVTFLQDSQRVLGTRACIYVFHVQKSRWRHFFISVSCAAHITPQCGQANRAPRSKSRNRCQASSSSSKSRCTSFQGSVICNDTAYFSISIIGLALLSTEIFIRFPTLVMFLLGSIVNCAIK